MNAAHITTVERTAGMAHKGAKFPPEPLTPTEVQRLMAAIPTRSTSGIRFRALVGVMLGGGLRVAEALALEPRDVDAADCSIRVRSGKGKKTRVVGLDPVSCELLSRWLDRRASLGLTNRHPVFATYSASTTVGRPMNDRFVRAALARYAAKAGITKRVHPHGLRHTMAFGMAREGLPLTVIQAQLGHASLDGTAHYVAYLAPTAVIDTMRARNPYADRETA